MTAQPPLANAPSEWAADPAQPKTSDIRELSRLTPAIERGKVALERLQRADGSWEAITDLGPTGPAMHWIVEHKLGAAAVEDREQGLRYLLAQQQPDGSFLPYPGAAEGTAGATGLCRAGLLACGLEARHPALRRAEAFIERRGGYAPVAAALMTRGDPTLLFLVAQGVVGPELLPRVAPELALTPFERLIDRKMHAGNVMVLLTLCAFTARYAQGVPRGFLATAALRAQNLRIQRYLFSWQNDAGDWNGQACQTWLMLLGLSASGLDKSDPRIARGLSWLRGLYRREPQGLTLNAMNTDVWNTSLALMALCEAGSSPDDPICSAAISHLLSAQVSRPMPRVNQRKSGAVRAGGWPFQRGNDTMQDSDDTGLVLAALGSTSGVVAPRRVWNAIEQGKRWLADMQNPDGGFPAFVWNLPSKRPGPMYLNDLMPAEPGLLPLVSLLLEPPLELSDPAAEGITGRVLWGLGACGVTRDDPAVCRAVAFLRAQQCENGAFWGRWMTCYLVETATTLVGLRAVGEDMQASYVERALAFVRSKQNPDGGFGEAPEAYRDPRLAGRGPSSPPVTGFVLLALLTAGPVDASIERAAEYLLTTQLDDGSWDNGGWLHTMIPPDSFYTMDLPAKALPLQALARFGKRQAERA